MSILAETRNAETEELRTRPWPGLEFYREADRHYFYGRDEASADLLGRIRRHPLTIVFGPSGVGKTSLLNAGVFPRLREAHFLPVMVRFNFSAPDPFSLQVKQALLDAVSDSNIEQEAITEATAKPEEETLWEYLHRMEFWDRDNYPVTPVLMFDQFEEMFTRGTDHRDTTPFLTELADLAENYIPEKTRDHLSKRGRKLGFPHEHQPYRLVLALREDFVAQLDRLRPGMPSVMQNRFMLAALNGKQALDAVTGPGKGVVSERVAKQIVRFVAGEKEGDFPGSEPRKLEALTIEPALLCLVCRELNERRLKRHEPHITSEMLSGSRERILEEFYERSFQGLPAKVREFVEDELLTSGGYRDSRALEDARSKYGIDERSIHILERRRLIRTEKRLDVKRIELIHDLLTSVVARSRDSREALKRSRRRRMWLVRLLAFSGVAALVVFYIVWSQIQEIKLSKKQTVAQLSDVVESRKEEKQIGSEKDTICIQSAAFTADRRFLATWETLSCDQQKGAGRGRFRLRDLSESKFTVVTRNDPVRITHVKSVAVNGDGTHLALLDNDGIIWHRKYDERDQQSSPFTPLHTQQVQTQQLHGILAVAESPDARHLVSSGWYGEVKIWDAESREPIKALASGQKRVWDVAFNPKNSKLIATAGADGSIKLWRLPSGEMLHTLSSHSKDVRRIAFSPDGRRLASASWDHSVKVWEPGEDGWVGRSSIRSSTLSGHTRAVNGVAFNRTGNKLASCASDGTIKLWRPSRIGWQLEKTLRGHKRSVRDIAFSPDGGLIASVSLDGMVLIWDIAKGETVHQLHGHTGAVWSVDYNSQGTRIATAGKDGSARVWDTHTGQMLHVFEDPGSSAINRAFFTGYDKHLITAGDNGSIIWWNLESGNETKRLGASAMEKFESIAMSPSGEHIAAIGQRSRRIMILNTDYRDGRPEFLTTQTRPQSVFFSPHTDDSFLLAVLSDGSLKSWKVAQDGNIEMITEPTVNISNLISFNEEGSRFATLDLDGKPVVYTFPRFDTLLNSDRIRTSAATSIALSPRGQMLAAGDDNEINIWRLETRSGFLIMRVSWKDADLRWLSFSADGKNLYAIGKTGSVKIYPIQ